MFSIHLSISLTHTWKQTRKQQRACSSGKRQKTSQLLTLGLAALTMTCEPSYISCNLPFSLAPFCSLSALLNAWFATRQVAKLDASGKIEAPITPPLFLFLFLLIFRRPPLHWAQRPSSWLAFHLSERFGCDCHQHDNTQQPRLIGKTLNRCQPPIIRNFLRQPRATCLSIHSNWPVQFTHSLSTWDLALTCDLRLATRPPHRWFSKDLVPGRQRARAFVRVVLVASACRKLAATDQMWRMNIHV